jgi:hypothetical protein
MRFLYEFSLFLAGAITAFVILALLAYEAL